MIRFHAAWLGILLLASPLCAADWQGDFLEDATVRVWFSSSALSGAPANPSSSLETADVIIYKNGSTTQKTTANGLSITSGFDSLTGIHHLAIDTSVDTGDSGFWTTGSDYAVVLSPDETVDGIEVRTVLATFSIENRAAGDLTDLPTVGDLNARTLPSANYATAGQASDLETTIISRTIASANYATSASLATMQGNVTTIVSQTLASAYRAALGFASANADTQLSGIATNASTAATQSTTAATQATAANTVVSSGTHGNAAINTKIGTPSVTLAADIATRATPATAASAVIATTPPENFFTNAPAGEGGGGGGQPRINDPPAKAYTAKVSARSDGTHEAYPELRPRPSAVLPPGGTLPPIGVEMSPLYGTTTVIEVGTPIVPDGTELTATAMGPHDTIAMVQLGGVLEASETVKITIPVKMRTGEWEPVDVIIHAMPN